MGKDQDNIPHLLVFTETQESFSYFLFSLFNWSELFTASLTPSTSSKPPVNTTKCDTGAACWISGMLPRSPLREGTQLEKWIPASIYSKEPIVSAACLFSTTFFQWMQWQMEFWAWAPGIETGVRFQEDQVVQADLCLTQHSFSYWGTTSLVWK